MFGFFLGREPRFNLAHFYSALYIHQWSQLVLVMQSPCYSIRWLYSCQVGSAKEAANKVAEREINTKNFCWEEKAASLHAPPPLPALGKSFQKRAELRERLRPRFSEVGHLTPHCKARERQKRFALWFRKASREEFRDFLLLSYSKGWHQVIEGKVKEVPITPIKVLFYLGLSFAFLQETPGELQCKPILSYPTSNVIGLKDSRNLN